MSSNVIWYNIIALKKHGIVRVSMANGKFACVDLREYFFVGISFGVCVFFRQNIILYVSLNLYFFVMNNILLAFF